MAILTAPKTAHLLFETGELAPKGTYVATCTDIKDMFGVERQKYQSDETEKVNLTAFLFVIRDKQGKEFKVSSRSFRISGSDKSALYAFLKAWLGEAPKMGWDYTEMKGRQALLTVEHVPSTNKPGHTYAGIASISPVPEGFQAAPAVLIPADPAEEQVEEEVPY